MKAKASQNSIKSLKKDVNSIIKGNRGSFTTWLFLALIQVLLKCICERKLNKTSIL